MEYAAYIVLGFTGLQFFVAILNMVFSQPLRNVTYPEAFISVLIPARNEEDNIGNLLSDLRDQPFRNIEVIVFDDESTDATAGIVNRFSANDHRFSLIQSEGLSEGWLGKNHACHNLAHKARGEYFLFLDADVRINNELIPAAVNHLNKYKLSLLSIFPGQIMISPGEKAVVPLMTFILLTLLPMILVRKSPFASLSAANGQFMLFRAETYREVQPHSLMRGRKVEDIAIIRYLKEKRYKVACLGSSNKITCRMYNSYREAIEGFSKNLIMFFGNSYLAAILFWFITVFGFIPLILTVKWWVILIYFLVLILTRIIVSVSSRQPVDINLKYLIPQNLNMGIIIYKSMINRIKRQYNWKGRSIS